YKIVIDGNVLKFRQNKALSVFLLNTKDKVLVEASPYDRIWGIGISPDDENIVNPYLWKGENLLGFGIMEVRDILFPK
ncbi:MAG: NADAR family protein, partial [bacterium]|nr:NADAR family protein [bacterium]